MSLPLQGLHLSSPTTITHLSLLHNISSLYFLLSSFEDIRVHETRCRDSPSTGGLLFLVSSPPSPLFSLFVHIFYFNSTLSYFYFFSLFCFYFFLIFLYLKVLKHIYLTTLLKHIKYSVWTVTRYGKSM